MELTAATITATARGMTRAAARSTSPTRIGRVARLGKFRPGPIGVAITLFDLWRRLPPKQRKLALQLARKHGPKAAAKLMEFQRARGRRGR
jgi:hypothetical protein